MVTSQGWDCVWKQRDGETYLCEEFQVEAKGLGVARAGVHVVPHEEKQLQKEGARVRARSTAKTMTFGREAKRRDNGNKSPSYLMTICHLTNTNVWHGFRACATKGNPNTACAIERAMTSLGSK